jgi:SAM-dependent methyltransferase
MTSASDGYREDLAYIHDVGFGQIAEAAGPILIDAMRARGHASGLIYDLGCGGGILARALVEARYEVCGIDISSPMISLARERVPGAQFRVESILSAELTACVGVAAVGECVNYLFDADHSLAAVEDLLGRIHAALLPGGILLLDVAEPGRVPGGGARRTWAEGADWAVLVESEEHAETQTLTRRITSFRQVGSLFRRERETHRLRLITRASIDATLRATGFTVEVLSGYGTLQFPAGLVGFLARKG